MMMPSFASKPSISTSSWLSVCSRSSLPPPRPAPRDRPTASISSIKMIQGALRLACSNMSRTRLAPTPTNISTKSEPEIVKNGTPASPAMARASSVLPVPGGPTSSAPLGILPPRRWNFAGSFRKSTTSSSSSLASSTPATSSNVTRPCFSVSRRARDLPKLIAPRPPPPDCIWRMKKIRIATMKTIGSRPTIKSPRLKPVSGSSTTDGTSSSIMRSRSAPRSWLFCAKMRSFPVVTAVTLVGVITTSESCLFSASS
mmetsp:Transcript_34315/g.44240  ORF Transcript_34315/g.44240 Transcript_34315/m.44240 type:complete len:257 (+) Transcript_34315:1862-2632(+)